MREVMRKDREETRVGRDRTQILFFFNDTATTEIYTLSLHDALPIYAIADHLGQGRIGRHFSVDLQLRGALADEGQRRSEEHTSELQSRQYLVCRLLLEKKKTTTPTAISLVMKYFRSILLLCLSRIHS